ncbi:MAG: BadF/BadG/BcrA/BcrD ATPase family protein [Acidobacteriota bacterium]|jgi:benzoyl-CoA reductase subunit A
MSALDCVVGIDLGSTTTKAVILDGEGRTLGRGITNSRSNYDVACAVARSEAVVDARVNIVRRALEKDFPQRAGEVLELIDRSFRKAQHRAMLRNLRDALLEEVAAHRHDAWRRALEAAVGEILETMDAEATVLFEPGAEKRSDFFRDLASSSYMRHAEEHQDPRRLPYEELIGIFDKAILIVENEMLDLSFDAHVEGVLDQVRGALRLSDEEYRELDGVLHNALDTVLDERVVVGTGYGRQRLPFPKEQIRSEILCHGLGAHAMFPGTATVLDIGGQDTKAIQVDGNGIVTKFQMNDRCAAGCGRYLGYIADEMNMGVHELGPLAMQAERHVKINSTCTVFAGAELRDRLNLGQRREDILAGLHRAVMLRAMSLLARSGGIDNEFTFTGGVARNEAATTALRELVAENYGERTINISPNSIYTGALGAALFALRALRRQEQPEGAAA